jgi:hypothetical protein
MKSTTKALVAINRAIAAIDVSLAKHDIPATGPASMAQLTDFRRELLSMLDNLQNQDWPRRDQIHQHIGRIIVDSWPLDSELGDMLIRAENMYIKCTIQPECHNPQRIVST